MSANQYNLNNSNNGYNLNYNNNYNTGYQNNGGGVPQTVAYATNIAQAEFYRKTYSHVALALLAFIVVEVLLLNTVPASFIYSMVSKPFVWLFVLGGFWLGSVLAQKWAFSLDRKVQYIGLGVYVFLEAFIFLPMIAIALTYGGGEIISQAGIITLALFGGLTAVVFLTKVNFSFLRTILIIGGFIALGLIVAGAIFDFNLGLWFSVAMVLLAGAGILYQTYNIKNQFSTDQYVGASLLIFSSVMLLFWYVLRILLALSRRN